MKKYIVILILLISSTAFGANDFSGDSDCIALWAMDDGVLTVDDIGSNTITNNGAGSETVDYKEGDGCAEIVPNDYFTIVDADLDAGYPLKSDDTTKLFSFTAWVKFTSLPAAGTSEAIYSKYNTSSKRSFMVAVDNDGVDGCECIAFHRNI